MDSVLSSRVRTKTCPLFAFSVEGARLLCLRRSRNSPAWLQQRLVRSRHCLPFSPPRVRTKTSPLFAFSVEGAQPLCLRRSRNSPAWLQQRLARSRHWPAFFAAPGANQNLSAFCVFR